MMLPSPAKNSFALALYSALLRVRPAQLGDLFKRVLGVRRCDVSDGKGHTFWIDPVSTFGLELLRGDTYEPGLTRIVLSLLRRGDVFLDIGGNEGYYSILAGGKIGTGQVHCFEPQSRLQAVLERNRELNQCQNLHIHCLALSDREGEVNLYLRPSQNTGASSLTPHWRLGRQHQTVPSLSLDIFIARAALDRVRLVKMDCEGAESLVIAGAAETLARQVVDFWAIEFHPSICGTEACEKIDHAIRSHGYHHAKVCGHEVYHRPGLASELQLLSEPRDVVA